MQHSKHSDGTTSVKVHHAPGGKSNFSLSWDNEPQQAPKKNQPVVNNIQPQNNKNPGQNNQNQGQNNQATTSVKVHAPPGGKSNFTLG